MARARIVFLVSFLSAIISIQAKAGSGVDNFNLPGRDYKNFDAHSALVCQNSCGGEIRCKGWTWVKPRAIGQQGHCWLKAPLPPLVQDRCCISDGRENINQADMVAEDKTDRPGMDYRGLAADEWQDCRQACFRENRCSSWTFRRRGVDGPNGACWLKSGVAPPVANDGFISGVKFQGTFD